ncbi:DsbA family protein [Bartonella sp. CB178]|uniref:DsbA family protein n=1 Tax=Bartonella sp. CB178 TaxID=3112255 RepID=UPI00300E6BEF
MAERYQHFITTQVTKLPAAISLCLILCSPSLSNTKLDGEKQNYLNAEKLKIQLLEDHSFLAKLKEKISPLISNYDIQETIREYLLANPEIMIQMQLILQEKIEKQKKQRDERLASTINLLKKEIFQSPHDAILGNPHGKTELVVFFDYNCGYCKKSYAHIANFTKKYRDLRIIVKDLPILGTDSVAAHTVAYAFRQQFPEKYHQFYKTLLISPGRSNENKAIKVATSLGADEEKLRSTTKYLNPNDLFQENIQIASMLGISGTPSYIVNNKVFIGAVGQEFLEKAIENTE